MDFKIERSEWFSRIDEEGGSIDNEYTYIIWSEIGQFKRVI